jgi:hypothetical protein
MRWLTAVSYGFSVNEPSVSATREMDIYLQNSAAMQKTPSPV